MRDAGHGNRGSWDRCRFCHSRRDRSTCLLSLCMNGRRFRWRSSSVAQRVHLPLQFLKIAAQAIGYFHAQARDFVELLPNGAQPDE